MNSCPFASVSEASANVAILYGSNVVNFHFSCAKRFSRVPEISDEGRQVYGEMSI